MPGITVEHSFQSSVADGPAAGKVRPGDWNAPLTVTLAGILKAIEPLAGLDQRMLVFTGGESAELVVTHAFMRGLLSADSAATLLAALAAAPLDSPAFDGEPTAPTPAGGDNSTRISTTAFVQTEIGTALAALIGGAPGALDTLNELAAAINDDASYAATLTTALAGKQPLATLLTNMVALTTASNKGLYFTGSNVPALFDLTAAGRALLDDADIAAQRATLALGTAALLDAGTGANQVVQRDGTGKYPTGNGGAITGVPGESKVVTFTRDMTAASGNQSVTGVGFVPRSILFFGGITSSFTFASVVGSSGIAGGASNDAINGAGINASIFLRVQNSTSQAGQIASFDADGFTITWSKGGLPTGTATIYALCLR